MSSSPASAVPPQSKPEAESGASATAANSVAPTKKSRGVAGHLWDVITSLRLAVAILALSAVLVFLGTLAQVGEGLYLAQERWFKSWIILRQEGDGWWVPPVFPGGYLLGTLFLVNMLCSHFRRFQHPPGGLSRMLAHYAVVFFALYLITWKLLWSPLYFSFASIGMLVLDLFVCRRGSGPLEESGRKLGVDAVHLGIAVLLVGQLSTDMLAEETHMSFREGETVSHSESRFESELVFLRDAKDNPSAMDEVTAIPEALVKAGGPIRHDSLPFTITVKEWMVNSILASRAGVMETQTTLQGAFASLEANYSSPEMLAPQARLAMQTPGRVTVWNEVLKANGESPTPDLAAAAERIAAQPEKAKKVLEDLKTRFRAEMLGRFKNPGPRNPNAGDMIVAAIQLEKNQPVTETSPPPQASTPVAQRYMVAPLPEARDMESRNIPSAIVEITGPSGSLGTWIVSPHLKEQTFEYDGRSWRVALRIKRTYHPFSMTLLKTTHEVYPGTDIPKDFRSRVRINNPQTGESREAEIYMNAPLRYAGLTFYQYQMGRDELDQSRGTSALQVVRNPGWFSPYFGCALVSYGMARHFLIYLLRFTRGRRKASAPAAA